MTVFNSKPETTQISFTILSANDDVELAITPANAQEALLWGRVKPGPHAVGFQSLYQLDHTRQYDPEFTTDPAQPPALRPRPISDTAR